MPSGASLADTGACRMADITGYVAVKLDITERKHDRRPP
jgi:hypothetical protein